MPEQLAAVSGLSGTEQEPVAVLAYRRGDTRLDSVLANFLAGAASLGLEGKWYAEDEQIIAKAW